MLNCVLCLLPLTCFSPGFLPFSSHAQNWQAANEVTIKLAATQQKPLRLQSAPSSALLIICHRPLLLLRAPPPLPVLAAAENCLLHSRGKSAAALRLLCCLCRVRHHLPARCFALLSLSQHRIAAHSPLPLLLLLEVLLLPHLLLRHRRRLSAVSHCRSCQALLPLSSFLPHPRLFPFMLELPDLPPPLRLLPLPLLPLRRSPRAQLAEAGGERKGNGWRN